MWKHKPVAWLVCEPPAPSYLSGWSGDVLNGPRCTACADVQGNRIHQPGHLCQERWHVLFRLPAAQWWLRQKQETDEQRAQKNAPVEAAERCQLEVAACPGYASYLALAGAGLGPGFCLGSCPGLSWPQRWIGVGAASAGPPALGRGRRRRSSRERSAPKAKGAPRPSGSRSRSLGRCEWTHSSGAPPQRPAPTLWTLHIFAAVISDRPRQKAPLGPRGCPQGWHLHYCWPCQAVGLKVSRTLVTANGFTAAGGMLTQSIRALPPARPQTLSSSWSAPPQTRTCH